MLPSADMVERTYTEPAKHSNEAQQTEISQVVRRVHIVTNRLEEAHRIGHSIMTEVDYYIAEQFFTVRLYS